MFGGCHELQTETPEEQAGRVLDVQAAQSKRLLCPA
jgi:hypothetical protein